MTLRVQGTTGEVVLTIPSRASLAAAQGFVDQQAGWIATRRARLPDRVPLSPGETIPLRGEPHLIVHDLSVRSRTTLGRTPCGPPTITVGGTPEATAGRIRRFLGKEAAIDLGKSVETYAGRLGVDVARVTLRDTRSRWGSCSSRGTLSFSWRLILAPPVVLDYLAAHEVAHLVELNHSARFWKTLRDVCPGTDEAETWLKRHGSGLHRYG